MERREFLKITGAASAGLALSGTAAFAEWKPRRPVNVILPYKAGGGTDSYARAVASAGDGLFPVPFVVVNKPGSSGMTGATEAARGRADGTTVMLTSAGSFLLTSLLRDTDVTPLDSFRIVAQIGKLTTSLMVPASSPYQSLDDLVADIKARPGEVRWAHTGNGGFHHVAGQGFLDSNELDAVGVPFKGGSATRAALIGEQVDFAMIGIQQAAGFENELRPLALNSDKRDAFMTDVPTFSEAGFEAVDVSSPIVLFAPKDTPDDVVARLEAAMKEITESQAFIDAMAERGNTPVFLPGAEAEANLKAMKDNVQSIIGALKS
ncbi:Tripartite tricarboxylate transporter family receptor [Falsiruegeria litorea R37]|uniref:Tripartite tricarboxylate transporter family receptor n=1 Tax=Falsiruegeria litorea R37 TaxID=1200284 RepID=A0A1Y5TBZ3_9RHOB|nr:tripartite tricarboxylate transporter substrate binding protein [Falsiruegeria litorea]SLN56941.1 Tripartite tricarboxylate transporter family receptor [Falsiruegeria litorea R37]SLN56972.1 Tripartite tricarboxylate transporter family receptor [Falsiruegeria litorea R37]